MKYPAILAAVALALIAAAPTAAPPALQATPTAPPPPPQLQGTPAPAAPAASATPQPAVAAPQASPTGSPDAGSSLDSLMPGVHAKPKASPGATPTPPPDQRKGLDGVWEIEIQRPTKTDYEHMNIVQSGTTITGTYLTQDKKKYPVAGSLDGKTIRLVVSLPDGSTILLEARIDGTTDMLGMLTSAAERIPFTAEYRPKEKWTDNINAVPGGLGQGGAPGGYQPPR